MGKEFSKKQRRILMFSFGAFILSLLVGMILDRFGTDLKLSSFLRPESYEADRTIRFMVEAPETKEFSYEGKLGARKLSESEAQKAIETAFLAVEKYLKKGEGTRRETLFIPERMEGSPVEIEFQTDAPEVVLFDGKINYEEVKAEREVKLYVTISYEEMKEMKEFSVMLHPLPVATEDRIREEIREKLDLVLQGDEEKEAVLPETVGETKVRYFKPKEKFAPKLSGLFLVLLFSLFVLFKHENRTKEETREQELKEAYAYFTGRFVILLGAGVNLLSIWKKLSGEGNFNEGLAKEIRMTIREVENGKTEREAYENFGKRIGGLQYTKFSSILTENLRTGSGQLLKRLGAEAEEAMAERKNRAKVIGETTGTKLLMPMMVELMLVMAIIMIPSMMLM